MKIKDKVYLLLGVGTHFKDSFVVYKLAVNDCTVPKTNQMYFLEYSFFSEAI